MRSRVAGWAVALPLALGAVILGIVGLVLVRYGPLDASPWAYIAVALAAVGALASLLLCVGRAREVTER